MLVIEGYAGLAEAAKGAVVALGNFDGVHLGHVALIDIARGEARRLDRPLAVLTFEPHPRQFFQPDSPPFRLTTREVKLDLLARLGVEIVFAFPFTPALAAKTALEFRADILEEGLVVSAVVAGPDFRFGKGREGGMDQLTHGSFDCVVAPVTLDPGGLAVSSSRIRAALEEGDPREAARLLGRPYTVEHIVQKGDQRGRTLGFATANGSFGDLIRPRYGIYAVRVILATGECRDGVASIGIRPMWETEQPSIETHIFDFDQNLYGQSLAVQLIEYLRPEQHFDTVEALITQINLDCTQGRAMLLTQELTPLRR